MKLYGAFSKVEEQDDGTIIVEGVASSEAVDADGEVVKAAAIEAALPDYMRHGSGALREMHQPIAAGTAVAQVADGVTTIKGHVVDPVAVKKVKTGVYKGFSIGGKVTARDDANKNEITGLKLVEISLVDRPANPDAVLTMWKADAVDDGDAGESSEEASTEEAPAEQPITKSLWQARCLISILQDLRCLQSDAAWEAKYEADSSPVPAQLKAAVNTLADILVAMVGEEVAEIKGDGETEVEVIVLAEGTGDLEKVEEPETGKAEVVEPAVAAQPEGAAELDLTKFEGAIADLINKAVAPLQAEIERLKAQPAAPKGVVLAISKVEDAGQQPIEKVEPVLNPDGSINDVATDLKKLHRAGGVLN